MTDRDQVATFTECKACGQILASIHAAEDRLDGLCSRAHANEDGPGCYGSFVDFSRSFGVEIRRRLPGYTNAVTDWGRAEVQVLFDLWLENGRPPAVIKDEHPF